MNRSGEATRRAVLLGGAALGLVAAAPTPRPARRVTATLAKRGSRFRIGLDKGAITSLRHVGDRYDTDYLRAGAGLGAVRARVRVDAGDGWTAIETRDYPVGAAPGAATTSVSGGGVTLTSRLTLDGEALRWAIELTGGAAGCEVGDLYLPLPMHTRFEGGRPATESVLKHSFVSGHGSHVFWMRSNSVGPFLLMLPDGDAPLEYWTVQRIAGEPDETWCAFLHAGAAAAETAARGTKWRLPVSTLRLAPGEMRRYAFRLRWVSDYAAVRAAIAEAGGVDVEVAPGMSVPSDLHVDVALASSIPVERLAAEHPGETAIERLPDRAGRRRWRLRFARLGENRVTIHQPGGRRTELEFFATEPVEKMIAKRAAFIARRQHRDPAKWYDGLFGEWNMATGVLLGPDNYDRIRGWRIYEVTCDDPGLSKPAYLAGKNAEHPVAVEVAALDRYIAKFVWGGLQMNTAEPLPYVIYGIPDWKRNRESEDLGNGGRRHVWRPYDYPHVFAMYHAMFRIARDHPAIPTALPASAYLARAAGTAIAMFTVPQAVTGWSGYDTGFYNECVIPQLINDLRDAAMATEADTLARHWATKVRRFVAGAVDLFGSEYPFDSTGFESTQALARSALDRPAAMCVSAEAARAFAERQIAANLFCRGWIEPAYYYLGSDYRGSAGDAYTLTYMAQMGGWAVLDYALNDADDPHPLLRLGYASQLSSWALLNSGTAASGYGYWYPGESNDGGAGGGFEPAAEGMTWLDQPHHRGSWYYSCEIDLGFCGALRAARTIVADDPLFGRIVHGGRLAGDGAVLRVEPRDGVRRRLHLRMDAASVDVELLDGRFAPGAAVTIALARRSMHFAVEPFAAGAGALKARLRDGRGEWRRVTLPIVDGAARLGWA